MTLKKLLNNNGEKCDWIKTQKHKNDRKPPTM